MTEARAITLTLETGSARGLIDLDRHQSVTDGPTAKANTLANRVSDFIRASSNGKSYRTRDLLRRAMNQFETFCYETGWRKSLVQDYQQHLIDKGHAPSTVQLKLIPVRKFCRYLEDQEFVVRAPHRYHVPIGVPCSPAGEIFSTDQYAAIKEKSQGTPLHWLSALAWNTGAHLVDCCMMPWSAFLTEDTAFCYVRQKLQRKQRICFCPILPDSDLLPLIEELREESPDAKPEDFICVPAARQYMAHSSSLFVAFQRILERCKIVNRSFSSFRNTMHWRLANSGMNLAMAGMITGNTDISVFNRYAKPDAIAIRHWLGRAFQVRRVSGKTMMLDLQNA